MAYTETKSLGYGARVSNSFRGIGVAFVLFVLGTVLLWKNEGQVVETAKALAQAESEVVSVPKLATQAPALEGELIHSVGPMATEAVLSDPLFGVQTQGAVRLTRSVEYRQWVEKSHTSKHDKVGEIQIQTTTYSYAEEWTAAPIDSGAFKNPEYRNKNFVVKAGLDNAEWSAPEVRLGAYTLSEGLLGSVRGSAPVDVAFEPEQLAAWSAEVARAYEAVGRELRVTVAPAYAHVLGNLLYFGENPAFPQLGDVRVVFTQARPYTEASVVAKVHEGQLNEFVGKHGHLLFLLREGEHSAEELFAVGKRGKYMRTWLLRLAGTFLVCMSLRGLLDWLVTLLQVLPILARMAALATGFFGKVLGLAWSLFVIAVAWVAYRPVVGLGLLAGAVVLVVWLVQRARQAPPPPSAASTP